MEGKGGEGGQEEGELVAVHHVLEGLGQDRPEDDAQDDEVPFNHALEMEAAWKNGRLVTTEGLGHRKLLRDPGVIQLCLNFFANRSGEARVN